MSWLYREAEGSGAQKIPRKLLGMRLIAWGEILFFFLVALIIDFFFFGGTRYLNICPHPFWIVVLLISVQYGVGEGIGAALIASIALLAWNIPPQQVIEDRFEYIFSLVKDPVLWFVAAVIIGSVRTNQIREREKLIKECELATRRERTIAKMYDSLKQTKEKIESSLAGQMHTPLAAYETLRALEKEPSGEILRLAGNLVESFLHPVKHSIFKLTDGSLEMIYNSGWQPEDPFLVRIPSSHSLFQGVTSNEILCVINEAQERQLQNQGVVAVPIVHPTSKDLYGMIKIEDLPFVDLNLVNLELLRMIGEWIGVAYSHRLDFEHAQETALVSRHSTLLTSGFYKIQREFLKQLAARQHFDLTQITASLVDKETLSETDKIEAARVLKEAVQGALRGIDLVFESEESDTEFRVLLPATPRENGELVIDKIKVPLASQKRRFRYAFSLVSLYENR